MSSSYKGLDLFGTGPHRFSRSPRGRYVVALRAFGDPSAPGSASFGDQELEIVVRGRLTAADDAALWSLRDALAAQAADAATAGELVDQHGRAESGMSLISYEEEDRTDRGRVSSIGYTAVFRRFLGA